MLNTKLIFLLYIFSLPWFLNVKKKKKKLLHRYYSRHVWQCNVCITFFAQNYNYCIKLLKMIPIHSLSVENYRIYEQAIVFMSQNETAGQKIFPTLWVAVYWSIPVTQFGLLNVGSGRAPKVFVMSQMYAPRSPTEIIFSDKEIWHFQQLIWKMSDCVHT